jgi:hypothetical protein
MNHQAILGSLRSGARHIVLEWREVHRGRFSDVTLLSCQMVKGPGASHPRSGPLLGRGRPALRRGRQSGHHHRLPRIQSYNRTQQLAKPVGSDSGSLDLLYELLCLIRIRGFENLAWGGGGVSVESARV